MCTCHLTRGISSSMNKHSLRIKYGRKEAARPKSVWVETQTSDTHKRTDIRKDSKSYYNIKVK